MASLWFPGLGVCACHQMVQPRQKKSECYGNTTDEAVPSEQEAGAAAGCCPIRSSGSVSVITGQLRVALFPSGAPGRSASNRFEAGAQAEPWAIGKRTEPRGRRDRHKRSLSARGWFSSCEPIMFLLLCKFQHLPERGGRDRVQLAISEAKSWVEDCGVSRRLN